MNIGIVSTYEIYNKENAIFDSQKYPIGDDLGYPFICLKKKLKEKKININTLDKYEIEKFEKILFCDLPNNKKINIKKLHEKGIELYLIILESEIIKKDNFDKKKHKYFKKIFTWNDELVDNKKYFKLNLANKIPENFEIDLSKKTKFCTMISGNKKNKDSRELYTERVKALEWFESNHSSEFDLYGIGWEEYYFQKPFEKLNRFKGLKKILGKKYSVYKGKVDGKREVLKKYKFSICYENARNIQGYITEKIFDCFFAGVIPIYIGPEEIENIIPLGTFIDKRKYETYEELYNYLINMSDEEYLNYIKNIKKYVSGKDIYPFSAENFVETIIQEIL